METSSHDPIALVCQEVKKLWLKFQSEWVHHNDGDGEMAPNASDEDSDCHTGKWEWRKITLPCT